jgi:hypothetical protein
MMALESHVTQMVATQTGIAPIYQHTPKQVLPQPPLALPGALLKWYALFPTDQPIPDAVRQAAGDVLTTPALTAQGFGFVILHRCGADFYFLIVATWRNNNELWETVFYKDGDAMPAFAPFPREGRHLPTFCVWELVPVWHEQQAWTQFLQSARDVAAAESWLSDCYAGPA